MFTGNRHTGRQQVEPFLTASIAKHQVHGIVHTKTDQFHDLSGHRLQVAGIDIASLRVDGGACVSNIMMQIQADFLNCEVNRPKVVETTALGAAYLAGLACGVWKDTDEIEINRQVSKIFKPNMDEEKRAEMYKGWKKAITRAMSWVEPQ